LITPENRIVNPIRAIALAASSAFPEHKVPRTMFAAPTHPRAR